MVHQFFRRLLKRGRAGARRIFAPQPETPSERRKRLTAAALSIGIAGAAAFPAAAGRLAISLVPKSTIGKGIAVLGIGAGLTSPIIRRAAFRTPATLIEAGQALGEEVERVGKRPGRAKTVGGLIVGAAAGLLVPRAIERFRGRAAEIPGIIGTAPVVPQELEELIPEKPEDAAAEKPVTPETLTVEAGEPKKKRAKQRPKARQPMIRQTVKVNVMQKQNARFGHKFIKNVQFG